MPIIQVHCSALSAEQKKEMIKEVTAAVTKVTKLPNSAVSILIQEYQPNQIGIAGETLEERLKNE